MPRQYCAAVAVFVLNDVSGRLGCIYTSKDAENYWEEDQSLRWTRCWKTGEKKQNIIGVVIGRNNKMAMGRSPSAQCLLIAYPHPLTPP